jgi:hypothetical protein
MPDARRYYRHAPAAPTLRGPSVPSYYDGAPCPTRSPYSLAELFACTR